MNSIINQVFNPENTHGKAKFEDCQSDLYFLEQDCHNDKYVGITLLKSKRTK